MTGGPDRRPAPVPGPGEFRAVRRRAFARRLPYDDRLAHICRGIPSHRFLVNPASQNVYNFLAAYLRDAAEAGRGKPLGALRVLDWGCGKGQVSWFLRALKADPVACDLAAGGGDSSFGQQTPVIDALGLPVVPLRHPVALPFADDSFDVVSGFGVLEHVADPAGSLAELRRVLAPGGLFFCFFLPAASSWTQRLARLRGDTYHDRLYRPRQARALLEDAGFDLLDLWRRGLFPKNSVRYPAHRLFERLDQILTRFTPLGPLATNIEFVARKAAP